MTFVGDAYLLAKSLWQGRPISRDERRRAESRQRRTSKPFDSGRDPRPIAQVLQQSMDDLGWSHEMAQARIVAEWDAIVGPQIAARTEVTAIVEGVVHVQCDSTTWATELRRLRAQTVTRIVEDFSAAKITDIRVHGPGAPSWRHGRFTVPGRGPRDTYG